MAYANVSDVQTRMTRSLTETEQTVCAALLDDAAVMIDAAKAEATAEAKLVVSCRMVMRALGDGTSDVPMGASQGSQAALGYSQSWTMGTGGATGELYLSKADRQMLGMSNSIGAYSPVQQLVPEDIP